MRKWVEYIVGNPGVSADFIDWCEEMIMRLSKESNTLLSKNEIEKAKKASYEVFVYDVLRRMIKKEMTENVSQLEYNQQNAVGG